MRAEFLKIRSMPTPRWCLIAIVICFVLGIAGVVYWGPEGSDAADIAVGVPTFIASIIFGVWMFGVEFGQHTARLVVTAEPRRGRVILVKLAATVLCAAGFTALFYLASLPVYDLAAAAGGHSSINAGDLARAGLSAVVNNMAYAAIGFAFALITASMAGGVTMALIFIFVIDTVTSLVPWVNDYAMGPALSAITDNLGGADTDISGDAVAHATTQDVVVVLAWLIGLIALGSLRFVRSEIK